MAGEIMKPSIAGAPNAALTSFVIPCQGQLEFTRLCVLSVMRHSREPFEFVFVDMDSVDGTAEYLDGLATAAPDRVHILRVGPEIEYHAACDLAIERSRAPFVAILSNDIIVPEYWVNQLIALVDSAPDIVAVGPVSNYAPTPQRVSAMPYKIEARERGATAPHKTNVCDQINAVAHEWRLANRGKWMDVDALAGFCVLLKRDALQSIGPLDSLRRSEGYTPIQRLDGVALSIAIRGLGFRLACCYDLFVHHFGSRVSYKTDRELSTDPRRLHTNLSQTSGDPKS